MFGSRIARAVLTFLFLALISASNVSAAARLVIKSPKGEWIGRGTTQWYDLNSGPFWVYGATSGNVGVHFQTSSLTYIYDLEFGPPYKGQLQSGKLYVTGTNSGYVEKTRNAGTMDISSASRACGHSGWFLVREISYRADGKYNSLAIDFKQTCDGSSLPLFGSFRYNSLVPIAPAVALGDLTVLKNDAGSSVAQVPAVLSMPSTQPASFHAVAEAGTAISGSDFSPLSFDGVFASGRTEIKIPVTMLGNVNEVQHATFDVKVTASSVPAAAPVARITSVNPNAPLTAFIAQTAAGQTDIILPELSNMEMTDAPAGEYFGELFIMESFTPRAIAKLSAPSMSSFLVKRYLNALYLLTNNCYSPVCQALTVSITKLTRDALGKIQTLSAFAQYGAASDPAAVYASIRFNQGYQHISITDAQFASGFANFKIVLNPASSVTQSVKFETRHGTAIGGVDYIGKSVIVTFLPGETVKIVPVQLTPIAAHGWIFSGHLSSTTSPLWIVDGMARIP